MKFGTYIERQKISQQQAAKELSTSQANISRWANGDMLPSSESMLKIYEWSGGQVEPNDFYLTEE